MFFTKVIEPLEMFSLTHILTIISFVLIVLGIFFSRNFFRNNKIADRVFRYTIAGLALGLELIELGFQGKFQTGIFYNLIPTPLCGHMLWFISFALLADSKRLVKLLFPIALTGAMLSFIVVNMDSNFPHFRYFHYFGVHGAFMLGAMYFFFTRKIDTFTMKDYGWSCFTLFGGASMMFVLIFLGVTDSYFLITPPKALAPAKDALGQAGYTIVYVFSIFVIMTIISLVTNLLTRRRKPLETKEVFKENRFFEVLNKLTFNNKVVIFGMLVFVLNYFVVLQALNKSMLFYVFDFILLVSLILVFIFNEMLVRYNEKKSLSQE